MSDLSNILSSINKIIAGDGLLNLAIRGDMLEYKAFEQAKKLCAT